MAERPLKWTGVWGFNSGFKGLRTVLHGVGSSGLMNYVVA